MRGRIPLLALLALPALASLRCGDSDARAKETTALETNGAKKPPLPGRSDLRETLDKALAEDRVDEAVATADVLALLFPGDAEVLELRARALSRRGEADAGARDLERCCELGRASCCGAKAP